MAVAQATASAPGGGGGDAVVCLSVDAELALRHGGQGGEIEKMFVEPGLEDNHAEDPFGVSDADTVLTYLKAAQG